MSNESHQEPAEDLLPLILELDTRRIKLTEQWDAIRNHELMNTLLVCLPRLTGADRCSIFLADPASGRVWLEAGTGVVQRQICVAPQESVVGETVLTGKTVSRSGMASRDGAHKIVGAQVDYPVDSALAVPVIDSDTGNVIGALQVLNKQNGDHFTDHDRKLLEEMAFTVQPSLQRLFDQQHIIREEEALDREIAVLRDRDKFLRPGAAFRLFDPVDTLGEDGFLHTHYNEKRYPPFINPDSTRHLKSTWDTEPNDVLICTHQKVGTHLAKKLLVELVLANMDHEKVPYADGDIGHHSLPWPEVFLSQDGSETWSSFMAKTKMAPRIWYTHCAYEDLPVRRIHPGTRFVVVVREPKAAAVSQYFFWLRHKLLGVNPRLEMDDFVHLFAQGGLYFGSYYDHVAGWIKRRDARVRDEQVCLMFYEDMVEKKRETILRLQEFLYPGQTITEEQIVSITAASSFDAMKADITKNPRSFHLNPAVYFRAGKTDDWKEKLTDRARAVIDEATQKHWGASPAKTSLERYL